MVNVQPEFSKTYTKEESYSLFSYLDGQILLSPEHRITQSIRNFGIYEPTIILIIESFVEAGFSFVDIGSHIGSHLLAAAFKKNHNQQKFIAFEPEEHNFLRLKNNCRLNGLSFVEFYQKGLGEDQGHLNLNISTNSNRMIHSFLSRPGTQTGNKVEVSTLDALFYDRESYLSPSILKIDVEGYENQVIRGGLKWFNQLEDLVILCEVTPYLLQQQGISVQDLVFSLKQADLHTFYIVKDPETFTNQGELKKPFFNLVFFKGELYKDILSSLDSSVFFQANTLEFFIQQANAILSNNSFYRQAIQRGEIIM